MKTTAITTTWARMQAVSVQHAVYCIPLGSKVRHTSSGFWVFIVDECETHSSLQLPFGRFQALLVTWYQSGWVGPAEVPITHHSIMQTFSRTYPTPSGAHKSAVGSCRLGLYLWHYLYDATYLYCSGQQTFSSFTRLPFDFSWLIKWNQCLRQQIQQHFLFREPCP